MMKIFDMQTSANIPAHKTENKHRKGEQKYVGEIKEIVADQLGIDEDDIKLESNFKEDLEADSLDLFELVMALEEEYGVEIPSEDLEKIATVNDIIEYLKNKGVEA